MNANRTAQSRDPCFWIYPVDRSSSRQQYGWSVIRVRVVHDPSSPVPKSRKTHYRGIAILIDGQLARLFVLNSHEGCLLEWALEPIRAGDIGPVLRRYSVGTQP